MFNLVFSHRTEALLDELASLVARPAGTWDPTPTRVVVPNFHMGRHVSQGLAQRLGIAANVQFLRLERFLRHWTVAHHPGVQLVDRAWWEAFMLDALGDEAFLNRVELEPVRRYLVPPDHPHARTGARRVQLALHLSSVFEEYTFSRGAILEGWSRGQRVASSVEDAALEAWQALLWKRAEGRGVKALLAGWAGAPLCHPATENVVSPPPWEASPVHVFGVSYFSTAFHQILRHMARQQVVNVLALSPSRSAWEEVMASRTVLSTEPVSLDAPVGPDLLARWGEAGRVHLHRLLEGADFAATFSPPALTSPSTLLQHLQHDLLTAAPPRQKGAAGPRQDGSVLVFRCANPRREAEAVAEEIWRLVRESEGSAEPLRFSDVAVLVASRERDKYFPHLASVFEEAHNLPCVLNDVPLASASTLMQGVLALLRLPQGELRRHDVMNVLMHPQLRGASLLDRETWPLLVERLGIFRGAGGPQPGDSEGDFAWAQGLRRLALGMAMDNPDGRTFHPLGDREYTPETRAANNQGASQLLACARSLLADVQALQPMRQNLTQWTEVLRLLVETYFEPTGDVGAEDYQACIRHLGRVARLDLDGREMGVEEAAEVAAHVLEGLEGHRDPSGGGGVTISTLSPLRAIPFRVVFFMGMAEGTFPAQVRPDALDLRSRLPLRGDVTPLMRDQYLFLEALMSTRERAYFTFPARNPQSGDKVHPSSLLQHLLFLLARGCAGNFEKDGGVRDFPLMRFSEPLHWQGAARALDGVLVESRARALGEKARADAGVATFLTLRDATTQAPGLATEMRALARETRLPPLPVSDDRRAVRHLSMYALRSFLDCPMQAWARHVLDLPEDERNEFAAVDEPCQPSPLERVPTLRKTLLTALEHPQAAVNDVYRRQARLWRSRGSWPTDVFASIQEEVDLDQVERWRQGLQGAVSSMKWEQVQWGAATEADRHTVLAEPLRLTLQDGTHVDVVGKSETFINGRQGTLMVFPRAAAKTKKTEVFSATTLLCAVRPFVSLAMAAATGVVKERSAHAFFLAFGDGTLQTLGLKVPAQQAARDWLATLAQDLLRGNNACFLPLDAVVAAGTAAPPGGTHAVEEQLLKMRVDQKMGRSEYGPVPNPLRHPDPSPEVLRHIMSHRFSTFFNSLDYQRGIS